MFCIIGFMIDVREQESRRAGKQESRGAGNNGLELEKIENYVAYFKGVYLDRDKLSKIVKNSGYELYNGEEGETFFDAYGKRYRISSRGDHIHEHGKGGKFVYRTFLSHEECDALLISRCFCFYGDSSDYHTDSSPSEVEETFILKEDELTRKIWERVFGGRRY